MQRQDLPGEKLPGQSGAVCEPEPPARDRRQLPLVERRPPGRAGEGGGAGVQASRDAAAGQARPGIAPAGRGPAANLEAAGQQPVAPTAHALDEPLPLAPLGIQRQPVAAGARSGAAAAPAETVQRVAEDSRARQEPGPNLEDLARRVYPFVKRLLAVERERLPR